MPDTPPTTPSAQPSTSSHRRRRHRRRGPRPTVRDATWLADELSRGASGGLGAARAVVRIADEVLRSVERIAWDVRGAAEQTSSVWQGLRGGPGGAEAGAPVSRAGRGPKA
jgi:hypothetical protein